MTGLDIGRRRRKATRGNADLQEEFETVLRRNTTRRLGFVWVVGHATKVHIDRQITTSLDKGGKDAADALASAAAAHHAAPQALTEAVIDRQRTAWDTHSFAAELLFRIRVALLALHEADRGQLTMILLTRHFHCIFVGLLVLLPSCALSATTAGGIQQLCVESS